MRSAGFRGPRGNFRRAPAEKFIKEQLVHVAAVCHGISRASGHGHASLCPHLRTPLLATVLMADLNVPFQCALPVKLLAKDALGNV